MNEETHGQLCEEILEYLALEHPNQLLRLMLSPGIPISDLTFAAEIAGRISDSKEVMPILLGLLQHPDPVVREGAIYGLAHHVDAAVIAELQRLVTTDLSPAVRTAAYDLAHPAADHRLVATDGEVPLQP